MGGCRAIDARVDTSIDGYLKFGRMTSQFRRIQRTVERLECEASEK